MSAGYIRHCDEYYRRTDGTPNSEADSIRQSIRPLKDIYGLSLALEFGSVKLKVCREAMIDADLCRNECNKRTRRIVRACGWAVENELVPASIWNARRAVKGLRKGKIRARETKPVRPVSDERINAAIPYVLPPIEAMIRLQCLTGVRSGEVVAMRFEEIDTTANVWLYRPEQHKTEYLDHERIVALGPRAQEVLLPWVQREPNIALFSPREAIEQLRAEMREKRKTKVQSSQRNH